MFVKDQNLIVFVYSYLIMAIGIGVIWIYSQMFKLSIPAKLTRPISETFFVFALVLIWFKSNVNSSEFKYCLCNFYCLLLRKVINFEK